MTAYRLLSQMENPGTSTGTATNVELAKKVLVFNNLAGTVVITIQTAAGSQYGKFTMYNKTRVIILKDHTDEIFASNAAVILCKVETN